MYDEYERALTGKRPRRGLSPLGWIGVTLGVGFVLGAAGIGYAVTRVAHHARDMVRELDGVPSVAAARVLSRMEGTTSLTRMDPREGVRFLESLDGGDPSRALVGRLVGSDLNVASDVPGRRAQPSGSVTGNDVSTLTLHSDDGDVHLNLVRGNGGGSLTIDSDDGHVRFDLVRDADGGRLVIQSDEDQVELVVGAGSREAPGWVPRPGDMPGTERPVFSLTTDEALLGAVTWEDDASPARILGSFRDRLEGEGYEVEAEHRRTGPDADEGSLWARRDADGRMVFLIVRREDGRTRQVLGYGQGDAAGR